MANTSVLQLLHLHMVLEYIQYIGNYGFHSGTDVSAPAGSNFVAMADGTVIVAAYHNSYGNYVMIDHRKRYSNFICTWQSDISKN